MTDELVRIRQEAHALRQEALAIFNTLGGEQDKHAPDLQHIGRLLNGDVGLSINHIEHFQLLKNKADELADINPEEAAKSYAMLAGALLKTDLAQARQFCARAVACQSAADAATDRGPYDSLAELFPRARILGTQLRIAQLEPAAFN